MVVVTDTNRSPVIGILAWLFLVISILAGAARLVIKYAIARAFTMDDYLISVAMALSVLQTACVSIAARHGLGQEQSASSHGQLEAALKSVYAAEMLYVACLTFAKLSALMFMTFLMQRTRTVEWGLVVLISAWAVVAEFAVAFQCDLPRPWSWVDNKCFDREAWWQFFGAMNVLTELALIVVPSLLVLQIQMAVARKTVVIGCFLTRLLVVGAIVTELVYRDRSKNAQDPMLAVWVVTICAQLVQCLAIVAACIPHLKPFMDGLQSTGLRLYYLPGERSRRTDYAYGSKEQSVGHELSGLAGVVNRTTVLAGQRQRDWDDALSQTSQSRIIRETKTWVVEEQYHPEAAVSRITDNASSVSHGLPESTTSTTD
ncbi:uncharacterized protein BO80DRAFT_349999 [Aspergillus ibericus CBS 121593]|uniref:Rhodopsin domain-containing protein n=1 Tax=Aspergillus ibericus CBS 121593 TaxID=1448316 RepID=A0A395H6F5_9EURO|nr:hypothetical protein BO80DRAFT_349999 [Aspergillus ibericus CBS 121593]RAL03502.1 hypothetical protein BO80DRAFT_349999 [Aspergillus ibericus CBS 121593]